jgi:23S rRNA (uracil1939-C5)-methyltransferase
MLKKNEYYDVKCIDISYEGLGVCRIDDFIIFVPNLIIGEKAKIKIVKLEKNYGYGELIELIEPSTYRVIPKCPNSNICGGCQLLHISYEFQKETKKNIVKNIFNRQGINIKVNDVIGMEDPYYYRNKMQLPVGIKDNKIIYGYYQINSHNIIPINNCYIGSKENNKLLDKMVFLLEKYNNSVYNALTFKGNIRHIIIKQGFKTNELMIIIVTNKNYINGIEDIIKELLKEFNITTIIQNINNKKTNTIMGDKEIILYGPGFIYDMLGTIKLKIGSKSFYQVNPIQTERLYDKAIDIANLNKNDIVLDAYSGIGSISFYISKYVKKVYGIEIIKEAVLDANENKKINNIKNVEFILGDVEKEITKLKDKNIDIVFLDPPRKGCSKSFLDAVINIKPKKIVYISCNVNTQARDILYLLKEGYNVEESHPVDMFPHTYHIENIVMLEIKK